MKHLIQIETRDKISNTSRKEICKQIEMILNANHDEHEIFISTNCNIKIVNLDIMHPELGY